MTDSRKHSQTRSALLAVGCMALLIACNKERAPVVAEGDLEIFEISVPSKDDPQLRDYTVEELGEGKYKVERVGIKVKTTDRPAYEAQLKHYFATPGEFGFDKATDPDQYSSYLVRTDDNTSAFGINYDFELPYETVFQPDAVISYSRPYRASVAADGTGFAEPGDAFKSSNVLRTGSMDDYRVDRGIYRLPNAGEYNPSSLVYVQLTGTGYSLYFKVDGPYETVTGRIDYRRSSF